MKRDLTQGPVMRAMLAFAVPMILGDLLQQCYNIADTLIVSRYLGANALAAVGSAYTLMTFITSILLGLSLGSGAVFSIRFGRRDETGLRESAFAAFAMIGVCAVVLNIAAYALLDPLRVFLRVGDDAVWGLMRAYLAVIFAGILATFLYNFFACYLRAVGDSVTPLIFLGVSAVLNIALDIVFVAVLHRGVAGAAEATVISQYVSGLGLGVFALRRHPSLRPGKGARVRWSRGREVAGNSALTCVQQSVMNLGILMVQGLVNSFGPAVMAAFAAGVKIDSFAYLPVQDLGNAFSTFIAQNHGAGKKERIRAGVRGAVITSAAFSVGVSALVFIFAEPLMLLFVDAGEAAIVAEGVRYLRIAGAFYAGIGILFLLYGLYRALERPGMSVVLTVISLGTRVVLAYALSAIPAVGVVGIWWAVPVGWFLADVTGALYYHMHKRQLGAA